MAGSHSTARTTATRARVETSTASGRLRPIVRGEIARTRSMSSPATTTVARPGSSRPEWPTWSRTDTVTPATAATITVSASILPSDTEARVRAVSACWASTRSRTAAGRGATAFSSAVRETESCAASTAVSTAEIAPARAIRGIRTSSAKVSTTAPPDGRAGRAAVERAGRACCGRSARRPGGEEGEQELPLEVEHLGALVLLHVVIAQQVQDRVHGQQQHLLDGAVTGLGGLCRRDRRAQHHVAEQALRGRLLRGARDELVHREAHHVGGAGQVEPLHVELLHRRLVDEQDRHLGGRVQVHRLEDEAGELDELALVDDRGGLVADLDGHERFPSFGRWRGSRLPPGRISQRP